MPCMQREPRPRKTSRLKLLWRNATIMWTWILACNFDTIDIHHLAKGSEHDQPAQVCNPSFDHYFEFRADWWRKLTNWYDQAWMNKTRCSWARWGICVQWCKIPSMRLLQEGEPTVSRMTALSMRPRTCWLYLKLEGQVVALAWHIFLPSINVLQYL